MAVNSPTVVPEAERMDVTSVWSVLIAVLRVEEEDDDELPAQDVVAEVLEELDEVLVLAEVLEELDAACDAAET